MYRAHEIFFGCFRPAPIFSDDLFWKLSPVASDLLDTIRQEKRFQSKIRVTAKNESPGIYCLVNGQAKFTTVNRIIDRKVANFVLKHELIGLTESISNSRSRFTIDTVTPCIFEFIKRDDFINFLENQPDVSYRIAKLISLNLNKGYSDFSSSTF